MGGFVSANTNAGTNYAALLIFNLKLKESVMKNNTIDKLENLTAKDIAEVVKIILQTGVKFKVEEFKTFFVKCQPR